MVCDHNLIQLKYLDIDTDVLVDIFWCPKCNKPFTKGLHELK